EFGPRDLKHAPPDQAELLRLFQELEFRSWVRELEEQGVAASAAPEVSESAAADPSAHILALSPETQIDIITDIDDLGALCRAMQTQKRVAIAIETDGAHFMQAQLV